MTVMSAVLVLSGCYRDSAGAGFEINGARADPLVNTNGVPSSASSVTVIQQIARDMEVLRTRFTELSDFSAGTNSATRIQYKRNADYVAKTPKCNSYYKVKPGGCLIAVEAWDAPNSGWPGLRAGPEIESIDRMSTNGFRIMAVIESPNRELRKAVRESINTRLKTAK